MMRGDNSSSRCPIIASAVSNVSCQYSDEDCPQWIAKKKQDATQERLSRKRCQLQFGIMIFVNLELGHDLDLQIILIQVDPMIT